MEILYILLGWLLGVLSPVISDSIKAKYTRRKLAKAIQSEAADLQIRLSIVSFQLAQRYGLVDMGFLNWLSPRLVQYKGNEPIAITRKLVESLLSSSEDEFNTLLQHWAAKGEGGVGWSLKRYSATFIESNLAAIHSLPVEFQSLIHEFRSQLSNLNQEIDRTTESHRMTFDSSMSTENHEILTRDLIAKYKFIQGMSMRVSDRLQAIIEYETKRI